MLIRYCCESVLRVTFSRCLRVRLDKKHWFCRFLENGWIEHIVLFVRQNVLQTGLVGPLAKTFQATLLLVDFLMTPMYTRLFPLAKNYTFAAPRAGRNGVSRTGAVKRASSCRLRSVARRTPCSPPTAGWAFAWSCGACVGRIAGGVV